MHTGQNGRPAGGSDEKADQRVESYGSPARSSATQVWLTLPKSVGWVLRYQTATAAMTVPTTPRPATMMRVLIVFTNILGGCAGG